MDNHCRGASVGMLRVLRRGAVRLQLTLGFRLKLGLSLGVKLGLGDSSCRRVKWNLIHVTNFARAPVLGWPH